MKKTNTIRELLGLTQDEIALVLQVSRSQWSMYEIGKRDLPLSAKQHLAELLSHMQSPETKAKSHPIEVNQAVLQQQFLERLLRENEYQQQRLAKEVAKLKKKRATETSLLQLVDFLKSRPTSKGTAETPILKILNQKASRVEEDKHWKTLAKLELRQELLGHEKALLEKKLHPFD